MTPLTERLTERLMRPSLNDSPMAHPRNKGTREQGVREQGTTHYRLHASHGELARADARSRQTEASPGRMHARHSR